MFALQAFDPSGSLLHAGAALLLLVLPAVEDDGGVTCPKCGGDVKQQMSQFIPKTSRKS